MKKVSTFIVLSLLSVNFIQGMNPNRNRKKSRDLQSLSYEDLIDFTKEVNGIPCTLQTNLLSTSKLYMPLCDSMGSPRWELAKESKYDCTWDEEKVNMVFKYASPTQSNCTYGDNCSLISGPLKINDNGSRSDCWPSNQFPLIKSVYLNYNLILYDGLTSEKWTISNRPQDIQAKISFRKKFYDWRNIGITAGVLGLGLGLSLWGLKKKLIG